MHFHSWPNELPGNAHRTGWAEVWRKYASGNAFWISFSGKRTSASLPASASVYWYFCRKYKSWRCDYYNLCQDPSLPLLPSHPLLPSPPSPSPCSTPVLPCVSFNAIFNEMENVLQEFPFELQITSENKQLPAFRQNDRKLLSGSKYFRYK